MANTTNFGWETPDDTDLVKDGAAAMRTLGNAIDTSFVDLKGGTTGQILSKASNTDLDYTWVTTDDANAIQNAIVDAKGDLIAASANDTPSRLAVGANETRLVADSAQSTGLKYVADTTNYAINAKGDLLAGTAADTLTPVTVGSDYAFLQALASAGTTGIQWAGTSSTSYTPSWFATGTAPVLGNGTFTGVYFRIGKLCFVRLDFTAGSTTTFGTGTYYYTLPFNYAGSATSSAFPTLVYMEDAGVNAYRGFIQPTSSSGNQFYIANGGGITNIGQTSPFTWGNGDKWSASIFYEVA